MNKFDRRIQAAVAYLFAGEPAEAANEMKSITPIFENARKSS